MTNSDVLCLAWMSGCCGLMALAAWRYRKWNRWTKAGETVSDPRLIALLDSARSTMGVRQRVAAVAVSQAAGPAVFGIWTTRLLLPQNFLDRLTDAELRLVLLHEMAHVRRKDTLLSAVLMAVQFLHWFNPLVWLALRRIRVDCELVCDEMVLERTRPEDRSSYGRLLLKLIDKFPTGDRVLPGAAAVGNQQEIKRRIIMIKNHGQNRVVGCVLAIIAMAVSSCTTFTRAQTSPPSQALSQGDTRVASTDDKTATSAAQSQLAKDLVGTWVLASGKPVSRPSGVGTRLKFITDTSWCDTQADPKTGMVIFHHGGTYTLKGNTLHLTLDYTNENTQGRIGNVSEYTIKVEGDTLTWVGIGNPWNEVWKRVK